MRTIGTTPARTLPPARRLTASTFEAACHAIATGPQDSTVQAVQPLTGTGSGQIAVRVGRVLVYVNDREALDAFVSAWREAETLAEQAFGPVLPPPTYRPRTSARKAS